MRNIIIENDGTIFLGKTGENLATQIQFPWVEKYRATFGEGTFQLLVKRATDEHPYAVSLTLSDDKVCWSVENTDVAIVGYGSCELQYFVGETLAKSLTWRTKVVEGMGEAGEAPEPWQSWIDDVLAAGSQAQESAQEAKESELNAKESEESALASAESASESEENARIYAGNASASASSAYTSEQNSAENAQNALEAMISSEASEQLASASASSASSSATLAGEARVGAETAKSLAEGYASSASSSAGQAQGYANSASGSASTASEKASQASASATQASTSASQASSSASSASASATSASESAGTASTKASEASASATSAQTSATQASASADSASASASSASASAMQALLVKTELENTVQSVHNLEGITADMVEESQVDFEDLSIASVPSTFNGATLRFNEVLGETRKPFNLWNEEWESGSISAIGTDVPSDTTIRSVGYIGVSTTSTYYCFCGTRTIGARYYDASKAYLGSANISNKTFTVPQDCHFMRFVVLNTTEYANDICINLSQPDTTVSPHNGEYEPHFDGLKSVLSTGLKFNGANLFSCHDIFEKTFATYSNTLTSADFTRFKAFLAYLKQTGSTFYYTIDSSINTTTGVPIGQIRLYAGSTNVRLINRNTSFTLDDVDVNAITSVVFYGVLPVASCTFSNAYICLGTTGTYTPYNPNASTSLTYPQVELKRVNELRDKLRLVRSGATWDFERVESLGKLDMGTLDYAYTSASSLFNSPKITNMAVPATTALRKEGILSNRIPVSDVATINADMTDGAMLRYNERIWIRDTTHSDTATFKASLQGAILYYELATPIVTKILTGLSTAQVQALFEHNSTFQLIGNTNDAFVKPDASIMVQSRIDLTMSDADLAEILAVFD